MRTKVLIIFVLVAFLNVPPLPAQRCSVFEAVNLIEKEYQENNLSLDQKCLYLIYALRNQGKLPQGSKILKQEELECGTPLVIEVKRNWNKLSLETKEKMSQLLERPEKPFVYRTTNFVIHYHTAGDYPVYQPWEHIDPTDRVTEEPSSRHPDRPYAPASYIIIGNGLRIPRYPDDPLPFCKATCVHARFQACQFVFTGQIGTYDEDYTSWLYESSSNWIEEPVWEELNDVYYYLNSYPPVSYRSLYREPGMHMSASWIWNQYLCENLGLDILLRKIGEKRSYLPFLDLADGSADWLVTQAVSEYGDYKWPNKVKIPLDTTYSYFKVGIHGQPSTPQYQYIVATNDSELIAQCQEQLALPEDQRTLHINGALDWGDGGFNAPWSWHIVPNDWFLAEISMELCDGLPQDVEDNLDYWINTVGRFCCWSSFIKKRIEVGDANGDGVINSADVVYLINYLFADGPAPDPLWIGDANCDGVVNSADVVHLINYLFAGGPPPGC